MGVLKVFDGTDWRKVGCGGAADASGYTSSDDIGWNTGVTPDPAGEWSGGFQVQPQLLRTMPSSSYYEVRQRTVNTVTGVRGAWAQVYANFGPFSITTWTYPHDFLGYFQGGSIGGPDDVLGDVEVRYATASSASGAGALLATWHHGVTVPGRLRLWTGSEWVREACDHDTAPIPFRTGGWRYLQVSAGDSTDRSAVSFDDSAWSIGSGAFGSSTPSSSFFTTAWAQTTRLWLRRSIPEAAAYKVQVEVDDVAVIYWNGNLLATYTLSPPTHPDLSPVYDVPAAFIVPGAQTLAIRATDTSGTGSGTQAKVDAEVTRFARPLKIEDPANPGTWITVACFVPV